MKRLTLPGSDLHPFSHTHPAVRFLFFFLMILMTMLIFHPLYQGIALVSSALCLFCIKRRKALRTLLLLLPFFLLISLINPLFSTSGDTVLFTWWGRPYTLEALRYGINTAALFVSIFLWFSSYSAVMSADQFSALFAPLLPAVSLLLVMVMRLIPESLRKARQIDSARRSIGKGADGSLSRKLRSGSSSLSALASWQLEGAVVTSDSMRARGYGSTKRTSFMLWRFRAFDALLCILMVLLSVPVWIGIALGAAHVEWYPVFAPAAFSGFGSVAALAAFSLLCLLPLLLAVPYVITVIHDFNAFRPKSKGDSHETI